MYAHITAGAVDFVLRVEPQTVFADPYASEFVPAPEDVEVGWLYDGETFTQPPDPDLDALKATKNQEINEARLHANFTSFTHAGKQIACDTLSRSDIDATNGYVTLNGALPPGWPGGWKAVDNTYLPVPDVAAWKALYASIFAAGNANFAHAQALKALLAAAATPAEVAAIQWGMAL